MILTILILIFILTIASTWWFGAWSNLITLVNLILAAMVATSFFENVSYLMDQRMQSYGLLLPYVSLWLLFAITFFVLRAVTDTLTTMRLRFDFVTETIGRSLLSIAIAWIFICFTMFTLQFAPLPPNLFVGGDGSGNSEIAVGPNAETFGPDNVWAGFVRSRSRGSFAASREAGIFPADDREFTVDDQPLVLESREFDPLGQIFLTTQTLRQTISKQKTLRRPTGGE